MRGNPVTSGTFNLIFSQSQTLVERQTKMKNLSELHGSDNYWPLSVPGLNASLHFPTAQSKLKFLPECCPPYGLRKKKNHITFNFNFRALISVHTYAKPTVPVAITMQAPSGRCQHRQGGKVSHPAGG